MKRWELTLFATVMFFAASCAGTGEGVGKWECDCTDRGRGCPEGFSCQARAKACDCVKLPAFKPIKLPPEK